MLHGKRIVVVMPAYNAEKTLIKTYNEIPHEYVDEVILVDDGSSDRTVEVAEGLGLRTFVHTKNRGYGGNQKTCYRLALDRGAELRRVRDYPRLRERRERHGRFCPENSQRDV